MCAIHNRGNSSICASKKNTDCVDDVCAMKLIYILLGLRVTLVNIDLLGFKMHDCCTLLGCDFLCYSLVSLSTLLDAHLAIARWWWRNVNIEGQIRK